MSAQLTGASVNPTLLRWGATCMVHFNIARFAMAAELLPGKLPSLIGDEDIYVCHYWGEHGVTL